MTVSELATALQAYQHDDDKKGKKKVEHVDLPVWISLTVNGRTERVPLVNVSLESGDGQWNVPAHVELKAA